MRVAAGSGGVETNRLEVRLKLHVCLLGAALAGQPRLSAGSCAPLSRHHGTSKCEVALH